MKKGIDKFSKRLDEIFDQGMPTKVQIIDAYNKFSQQQSSSNKVNIKDYVKDIVFLLTKHQPGIDKISATAFVESCGDMPEYVAGKKVAHRFRKYTIPVIEYNELRKAAKDFDNKQAQPEYSDIEEPTREELDRGWKSLENSGLDKPFNPNEQPQPEQKRKKRKLNPDRDFTMND